MRGRLVAPLALFACGTPAAQAPAITVPPAPPPAKIENPPPDATPRECEDVYVPSAPPSGNPPDLPPVPLLSTSPKKVGDAYTVFGAVHALRSQYESEPLRKGDISIVGIIVDTNIPRAPKCAWHKTGVADPPGCTSEMPSFVIADTKDTKPDDPNAPHIKVLGWARNFAVVFDADAKYKGLAARPKDLVRDDMWSVEVPYPLPAVGAKVRVVGSYGFVFSKSSTGLVSDPKNGVVTYSSLEVVP